MASPTTLTRREKKQGVLQSLVKRQQKQEFEEARKKEALQVKTFRKKNLKKSKQRKVYATIVKHVTPKLRKKKQGKKLTRKARITAW